MIPLMTNKPSDFAKDLITTAGGVGGIKGMSDVIGMPDEEDKTNIMQIIMRYENKHPGEILTIRNEAREQMKFKGGKAQEFGEVNESAHGRTMFELPAELHGEIQNVYPTMFSDKKHFAWFKKNFKDLMVPEKM